MKNSKFLTDAQVLDLLRREVDKVGSQKALAQRFGISQQYLGDVLKGRRGITGPVLDGLGLRCVWFYERKTF